MSSESYRPEDREAAIDLVREDAILKNDVPSKVMADTGKGINGAPTDDVGNWLADRQAIVAEQPAIAAREKQVRKELDNLHSYPQDNHHESGV